MVETLLKGFRTLDLTDEKGLACGKILATLGADVIKVEKPGGDSARETPPLYSNSLGNISLYWAAFNTDKRSITLDIEVTRGQEIFRKLVEKADFVIESFSPGYMERLGFSYEALKRVNPRIIMVSISHFGQKGPYADYQGSELVDLAMSGILGSSGDADRPPVSETPGSIYFHANAAAACGAVVSHYYREISGQGQQVDVSITEATTNRNSGMLQWWEFDKRLQGRGGQVSEFGVLPWTQVWQCKDGYVFWIFWGGPLGAPGNRALWKWMKEDGLESPIGPVTDWEQFDMSKVTPEMHTKIEGAISAFFLRHTKAEIEVEGLKRGLRAVVINNPADVLQNLHLKARNHWIKLGYPELGVELTHPRHFFLSSETENFVSHRAPNIGEDNDEIYQNELGLSSQEMAALKKAKVI